MTEEAVPPGAVSWAAAEGSATLDFAVTMSDPLVPEWRPPPPTEVTVADLSRTASPWSRTCPKTKPRSGIEPRCSRRRRRWPKEYAAMFTGEPGDAEG